MELSKEEIEVIDAFLRNDLSDAELKQFNMRLSGDPEFRQKVNFIRATKISLRESRLNEKYRYLQSFEKNRSKKNIFRLSTLTISAIAASIMIIFAATFLLRNNVDKSLIDREFRHVNINAQVTRSSEGQIFSGYRLQAVNLFNIREYGEAAPMLYRSYKSEQDTLSLYYAGLAYLASYNLKKAEQCLKDPALTSLNVEIEPYLQLIEEARK